MSEPQKSINKNMVLSKMVKNISDQENIVKNIKKTDVEIDKIQQDSELLEKKIHSFNDIKTRGEKWQVC